MGISIKQFCCQISELRPKTGCAITSYCRAGRIPSVYDGKAWYIDEKYVECAILERKRLYSLEEMISKRMAKYNYDKENIIKITRNLNYALKDIPRVKNNYLLPFSGSLVDESNISLAEDIIDRQLMKERGKNNLVPISEAANKMDISIYQLKKLILGERIQGIRLGNDWYLDEYEVNAFIEKKGKICSVYDILVRACEQEVTLFDVEKRTDRELFLIFFRGTEFKNVIVKEKITDKNPRNKMFIPASYERDAEVVIRKFVRDYGKQEERLKMLKKSDKWKHLPKTRKLLNMFEYGKTLPGMIAIYDILFYTIDCEIVDCDDTEVNKMMEYAEKAGKIIYREYLSDFLRFVSEHEKIKYKGDIKPEKRNMNNKAVTAYPLETYYAFAYLIYNDESIKKRELIKKAFDNPVSSLVWLYSCWHYIGNWRDTDFMKIPIITYISDLEEAKERIMKGCFDEEAVKISIFIEDEINEIWRAPNKTKEKQKERFLIIEIPTSLRVIVGLVYFIFAYHVLNGFSPKKLKINDYVEFYGDAYIKIFGNEIFSGQRANKSFLGEVCNITEMNSGAAFKICGYRVASFARAHKENEYDFSEVTSRYLEAKMDGYTKNEIMMALFEAGPLSFASFYLLEMAYGDDYCLLPFDFQNALIKKFNVSARHAEELSTAIDRAYQQSISVVKSFFRFDGSEEDKRALAEEMLVNLLNGSSKSKTIGIDCLIAARRMSCPNRSKENCMGCPYSIPTLSFFYRALQEIKNIKEQMDNSKTFFEKKKYEMLLNESYLPAMVEMLAIATDKYDIDTTPYADAIIDMLNNGGYITDGSQD